MVVITQWNINGIKLHKNDLSILQRDVDFDIACIQETHLKPDEEFKLKYFKVTRKDYTEGLIACGGVCIVISDDIPFSNIDLDTHLQAVAVRIHQPFEMTLCSLYLPPSLTFTTVDLNNLYQQLPQPCLILTDANSHSPSWGSLNLDRRGRVVEDFLEENSLCFLNSPSPTHVCFSSGTLSSIDLSITSPRLATRITWMVSEDGYGSDHFPITMKTVDRNTLSYVNPKWKLEEANWQLFQDLADLSKINIHLPDINEVISNINELIYNSANQSIPKTQPCSKRVLVPWWSEECEIAVKNRKKALRRFKSMPTSQSLEAYNRARAHARFIIKQNKRKSWQEFVSKIDFSTSPSHVWESIRRIEGRSVSKTVNKINYENRLFTDPYSIANIFGNHFQYNSSTAQYSKEFLRIKTIEEAKQIVINYDSSNPINHPFSVNEFNLALNSRKETAPGVDRICTTMIKKLSELSKMTILNIFNRMYTKCEFPYQWRHAIIIPVLKHNKPADNVTSYRPVSLTCTLCKLLEKLITNRLQWHLEKNNLLHPWQSGFRENRCTTDNLVGLENAINKAFKAKMKLLAVFIDIESAFDRTWRHQITDSLMKFGIDGYMLKFIINFLEERTFHVRCGSTISNTFKQENGVPQGSVLSPTLFCIALNDVLTQVRAPVFGMLYADDLTIYSAHKQVHNCFNDVQRALLSVSVWLDQKGFKISISKSVGVLFSKRKVEDLPTLNVNGVELPIKSEAKYLGLTFNHTLSWAPYLKDLKRKCVNSLNLLRILGNSKWGSDRKTMIMLYRSFIRAKLDYGCVAYGSASPRTLKIINTVHNTGLRLTTGAFRSSPIDSILIDAGEPPLEFRRDFLTLSYFTKINANPLHPLHEEFNVYRLNDIRPLHERCFVGRSISLIENLNFDLSSLLPLTYSACEPWTLYYPKIDLSLTRFIKKDTSPLIFKLEFHKIHSRYQEATVVFTDGSKTDDGVGCATLCDSRTQMFSLPNVSSIYAAELFALGEAVDICVPRNRTLVVYTDSLSSLLSLQNIYSRNAIISDLFARVNTHFKNNTKVVLCWIPSHCGIRGSDEVDLAAKEAIKEGIPYRYILQTDAQARLRSLILSKWQGQWLQARENKLREIKSTISAWRTSSQGSRRDEVVLSRLRIGHTNLTHTYLMKSNNNSKPECTVCGEILQ